MGAWICPTCRLHYDDSVGGACPADKSPLVMNLSGAQVAGHTLTHLQHVGPHGSTVWEATTDRGVRVALKLLRGPQDATAWSSAALLAHPHIVAIQGYAAIDDELACVVMQWLDGRTLAEVLAEGVIPLDKALRITEEILDALIYIHGRDLAHGDLHAEMVFIDRDEKVKLLDVGVHRPPPVAEILGLGERPLDWYSVLYAPPERLATGKVGVLGDVYGAGALLWHMCTGAPPFGIDPQSVARHHLTAPRPRLVEARPDRTWPPGLQTIIERAMAIRPSHRFASAKEMRDALSTLREAVPLPVGPEEADAADETVLAAPSPAPDEAPPVVLPPEEEEAGSGPAIGWFVVAVALLCGVGLMWMLGRMDSSVEGEIRPKAPGTVAAASSVPAPVSREVEQVKATPVTQPPPPAVDAAPAPPLDAGAPDASPPDAAPEAAASEPPQPAAPPGVARRTRRGSTEVHRARPAANPEPRPRVRILGGGDEPPSQAPRVPVLDQK